MHVADTPQDAFVAPEFISIGEMLKATPRIEGDRRILYIEASNEGLDQQGEVVAAKALADSAEYYKRYGNLDLHHYTLIGAKAGIVDYPLYEIGRPLDVGQIDGRTFVKGELFRGEGRAAEKANQVWSSMTEISPPQRWYPSVGGQVLGKAVERLGDGSLGKTLVTRVRWSNIALDKCPVNQHVAECATMPIGVFAKCWSASGLDISRAMNLSKAITAGYGTDSAAFSGGAALREQSLDGSVKDQTVGNYFDFRERMASALRKGECGAAPNAEAMHSFATSRLGMSHDRAAEHVERFMRDLHSGLQRKAA